MSGFVKKKLMDSQGRIMMMSGVICSFIQHIWKALKRERKFIHTGILINLTSISRQLYSSTGVSVWKSCRASDCFCDWYISTFRLWNCDECDGTGNGMAANMYSHGISTWLSIAFKATNKNGSNNWALFFRAMFPFCVPVGSTGMLLKFRANLTPMLP